MLLVPLAAHADFTFTSLLSFNGNNGANPSAPLLQAADGYLYGTTESGGTGASHGTVFKLTPGGALTTVCRFNTPALTGADPQAGLLQEPEGSFLGSTAAGGSQNQGTIFRLTPGGLLTNLYSFVGTYDGGQPHAALVAGADGNFYGTTPTGGFYLNGTVFQVNTNRIFNSLYSFTGPDGVAPYGGLVAGADGNLYGTTRYGGAAYDGTDFSGDGTLFQITLDGSLNTAVYFSSNNGAFPAAGLLQAGGGDFYGTTSSGGAANCGTVFKVSPSGALTTLASFYGNNGAVPLGNLVQDTDGGLYGTTSAGGPGFDGSPNSGNGTIYCVTTNGTLTMLFAFNGTNGSAPLAGLVAGTNGAFYGTTSTGGTDGLGTIFQFAWAPVFKSIRVTSNTVVLSWTSIPGHQYQLSYCTNLTQDSWTVLGQPLTATSTTTAVSPPLPTAPQCFYRLRSQ